MTTWDNLEAQVTWAFSFVVYFSANSCRGGDQQRPASCKLTHSGIVNWFLAWASVSSVEPNSLLQLAVASSVGVNLCCFWVKLAAAFDTGRVGWCVLVFSLGSAHAIRWWCWMDRGFGGLILWWCCLPGGVCRGLFHDCCKEVCNVAPRHVIQLIWHLLDCIHPILGKRKLFIICLLGQMFKHVLPVRGNRACVHIGDSGESVVKNNVILWQYLASTRIKEECHAVGVERGMSKVDSNAAPGFPFWGAWAACTLQTWV